MLFKVAAKSHYPQFVEGSQWTVHMNGGEKSLMEDKDIMLEEEIISRKVRMGGIAVV